MYLVLRYSKPQFSKLVVKLHLPCYRPTFPQKRKQSEMVQERVNFTYVPLSRSRRWTKPRKYFVDGNHCVFESHFVCAWGLVPSRRRYILSKNCVHRKLPDRIVSSFPLIKQMYFSSHHTRLNDRYSSDNWQCHCGTSQGTWKIILDVIRTQHQNQDNLSF